MVREMFSIRLILAGVCSAFLSMTASAATIVEIGDVSAPGPNVGALDVGLNTISGTLGGDCVMLSTPGFPCGGTGDLFDQVRFDVGAGLRIRSATLTATGLEPEALELVGGMAPTGTLGELYVARSKTGTAPFEEVGTLWSILNAGPGTYFLNVYVSPHLRLLQDEAFTVAWSAELTLDSTAAVPLPAGGLLLIGGLAALGLARRRAS